MSQSCPIMVVDDDNDTRSMIKAILVNNGYEVVECAGGQEAIDKLKTAAPALVILDLMMPEVSGYDVLVSMKQKPETQNIPVIVLTAKGDPEDIIAGYKDYGVEYYITKPFKSPQLLRGIKLFLG